LEQAQPNLQNAKWHRIDPTPTFTCSFIRAQPKQSPAPVGSISSARYAGIDNRGVFKIRLDKKYRDILMKTDLINFISKIKALRIELSLVNPDRVRPPVRG
jgi:hypothetical protein